MINAEQSLCSALCEVDKHDFPRFVEQSRAGINFVNQIWASVNFINGLVITLSCLMGNKGHIQLLP